MAHWAFRTTFTAVAGDHSFSSRSSGAREEVLARGNLVADVAGDAVGGVEEPADDGKVDAEVGHHAGILRALAGEEEGQAPGAGLIERLVPEIDAAGVADRSGRPGRSIFDEHGGETVGELGERRGDDSQAGCAALRASSTLFSGVGDVLERDAAGPLEPVEQLTDALDQAGAIRGGEQDGFGIPGSQCAWGIAVGGGRVFLEHGVGVDAGEAEGVHAGAPRRVGLGMNPGARLPVQLERAIRRDRAAGAAARRARSAEERDGRARGPS